MSRLGLRPLLFLVLVLPFFVLAIALTGCGGASSGGVINPPPADNPAPLGAFTFARMSGGDAAQPTQVRPMSRPAGKAALLRAQSRTISPRALVPGSARTFLMDHHGDLGTELQLLPTADYESTALSPDRKRIVFSAYANNGYYQLFLARADGSAATQLTSDLEDHWEPALSPDGARVVYVKGWGGLATMSSSGGTEQMVPTQGLYVDHPIYCSNTKVLFEGFDAIIDALFAVNTDGTGLVSFTPDTTPDYYAESVSLSPDGGKILYSIYDVFLDTENIYIADFHASALDGPGDVMTNITLLTAEGLVADTSLDPMFIDNKVVFVTWGDTEPLDAGYYWEVYSMNYDGTGLQRLTMNTDYEWFSIPWYMWY